ncbi:MAG: hypothetical protein QG574_4205 [Cyanobacteriota bacterium erpe_2018_sw_21hr_WHONDRS-SW48-000092_B_bin.40]|nr:hypothetical protein [Cyanobacteriota bacterium erpe_2018_sw_21hr_WHONDRS-SW48-000092_B_bin.40]
MDNVKNLAKSESVDNFAANSAEKQAEKFGNIAVDSWNQIGQNSKDAAGKSNLGNSKDGLTKDGTALTFSDPFTKNLMENPLEAQGKKMVGDDANMIQKKKELAGDDANMIQKKKELAGDDANMIQKKKELADSGKPGATVEGSLDFSPAKPKIPADGGLKDKEVQGSEIIKKFPGKGGPKETESTGKKPMDGGLKDPAFDQDYYIQKL